jgi:hypothetical protein
VQCFIFPYAGAAIVAALLTGMGILLKAMLGHKAPAVGVAIWLYLLPLLPLLYLHLDFNYSAQGTIALVFMLFALFGFSRIAGFKWRFAYACVMAPVLYGLAGSVAVLFVVTVSIWGLLTDGKRGLYFILPLVLTTLLAVGSVYFSIVRDFRFSFLPAFYYDVHLPLPAVAYASWAFIPVVFIAAFFIRKMKPASSKWRVIALVVQVALAGWTMAYCHLRFGDLKSAHYKETDYYARTGQWDKLIEKNTGNISAPIYRCYLNMALAERNELVERMFLYDQKGITGLFIPWQSNLPTTILLADVSFTMGYVAEAQRLAFEGNIILKNSSPRFLKRLVQTNLVCGAYPVAEKYIDKLEKTLYYKGWATSQRHFLYNDAAVEQDPLLGALRKSMLKGEYRYLTAESITADLRSMAENNPAYTLPVHYLGAIYLLTKDVPRFRELMERFYGTEVLPALPLSFQEAMILFNDLDKEAWKRYHISERVIQRFSEYRQLVLQNKKSSNLAGIVSRSAYRNTYWFYFMSN